MFLLRQHENNGDVKPETLTRGLIKQLLIDKSTLGLRGL